jgi:DNA-binding transcriptional LysR family regulator
VSEPTITGLQVLLEVGRVGSFSAAAESLGYTQSAISRQVASLENFAGAPLFERHARGVRPTAAGQVLMRHAGTVLDGIAAATSELAGLSDRLEGRLAVGAFPTAAASLVPAAIARLVRINPGLRVRLIEASTPAQLHALRRGRLEVAVLASGEGLPGYDVEGLRLTPLLGAQGVGVAVADSHRFAGREWVQPEELSDQNWIVGPNSADAPEFGVWPTIEAPRIAFTIRSWSGRLGFVAAGLGIALVPGFATVMMPRGVRWVRVRDVGGSDTRACEGARAADHVDGQAGLQRSMFAVTGPDPNQRALSMVDALLAEVE